MWGGVPYLLIDFSESPSANKDRNRLADNFVSANTDHPVRVGDVVFIPNAAFDEIINWNEYPRLIDSSQYSLWDNFKNS